MAGHSEDHPVPLVRDQAEEAAKYYVAIFKNSKIVEDRPLHRGREGTQRPPGSVMVVEFELEGQRFMRAQRRPGLQVQRGDLAHINCKDQEEIDYYWDKLAAGGDPSAQQCGWLKDKYGLSWQVALEGMSGSWATRRTPASQRAMEAMMEMKKIDVAKLEEARAGAGTTA